ncbi:hypothetical protein RD055328_13570 [Companilactobacillus sp. RD055328]|uniref:PucR family transcriptional regulator n=1 Tax=Companilactobacillus sp. RD055328 TaxID=2916634 RepID=UPI001FC80453|nr:PucR family transcriptional regulator [Companilactobacillus sp. RD055328]GKQ43434.1 hypothetical protein RD055328_13570 [Companilactobacillus sp. RD055328]
MIYLNNLLTAIDNELENLTTINTEYRVVSSITIIETFNFNDWVQGGEIILIDNKILDKINVKHLEYYFGIFSDKKIAALATKPTATDYKLNDNVKKFSIQFDIPILKIRNDINYTKLMNDVNTVLFDSKSKSNLIKYELTNMLLNNDNQGVNILSTLADIDLNDTLMKEYSFEFDDSDPQLKQFEFIQNTYKNLEIFKNQNRIKYHFNVNLGKKIIYFIFFSKNQLENKSSEQDVNSLFNDILKSFLIRNITIYGSTINAGNPNDSYYNFIQVSKLSEYMKSHKYKNYLPSVLEILFLDLSNNVNVDSYAYEYIIKTKHKLITNNLFNFLIVYFKNNESVKDTAKELFIHENTLRYNLKKITRLTGLEINNSRDKLALLLSVELYN